MYFNSVLPVLAAGIISQMTICFTDCHRHGSYGRYGGYGIKKGSKTSDGSKWSTKWISKTPKVIWKKGMKINTGWKNPAWRGNKKLLVRYPLIGKWSTGLRGKWYTRQQPGLGVGSQNISNTNGNSIIPLTSSSQAFSNPENNGISSQIASMPGFQQNPNEENNGISRQIASIPGFQQNPNAENNVLSSQIASIPGFQQNQNPAENNDLNSQIASIPASLQNQNSGNNGLNSQISSIPASQQSQSPENNVLSGLPMDTASIPASLQNQSPENNGQSSSPTDTQSASVPAFQQNQNLENTNSLENELFNMAENGNINNPNPQENAPSPSGQLSGPEATFQSGHEMPVDPIPNALGGNDNSVDGQNIPSNVPNTESENNLPLTNSLMPMDNGNNPMGEGTNNNLQGTPESNNKNDWLNSQGTEPVDLSGWTNSQMNKIPVPTNSNNAVPTNSGTEVDNNLPSWSNSLNSLPLSSLESTSEEPKDWLDWVNSPSDNPDSTAKIPGGLSSLNNQNILQPSTNLESSTKKPGSLNAWHNPNNNPNDLTTDSNSGGSENWGDWKDPQESIQSANPVESSIENAVDLPDWFSMLTKQNNEDGGEETTVAHVKDGWNPWTTEPPYELVSSTEGPSVSDPKNPLNILQTKGPVISETTKSQNGIGDITDILVTTEIPLSVAELPLPGQNSVWNLNPNNALRFPNSNNPGQNIDLAGNPTDGTAAPNNTQNPEWIDSPNDGIELPTPAENSLSNPNWIDDAIDVASENEQGCNKLVFVQNLGSKKCGLIQIDVYYGPRDATSRDFFVNQIQSTFKEFSDLFWINFVPFLLIQESQYSPEPSLTKQCKYEKDKCKNLAMHACVINHVPDTATKIKLITCIIKQNSLDLDPLRVLRFCTNAPSSTYEKIQKCTLGGDGMSILIDAFRYVRKAQVTEMPSVVVDGEVKSGSCLKHFKTGIVATAIAKGIDDIIKKSP